MKLILFNKKSWKTCADLESFVRGDPNLITFFFVLADKGKKVSK